MRKRCSLDSAANANAETPAPHAEQTNHDSSARRIGGRRLLCRSLLVAAPNAERAPQVDRVLWLGLVQLRFEIEECEIVHAKKAALPAAHEPATALLQVAIHDGAVPSDASL